MRKLVSLLLLTVFLAGSPIAFAVEDIGQSSMNAGQAVQFADPKLKARVIEQLEIGAKDVTREAMKGLKFLTTAGINVKSLKGLEHAVNLETLFLLDCSINENELQYVSKLANLKVLKISVQENNVRTIKHLAGLKQLEELSLEYMCVYRSSPALDVSAFKGMTGLKKLSISTGYAKDISAIRYLTNLEELYLFNNYITDIGSLQYLKKLKRLTVIERISNISSLKQLTNLEYLSLYGKYSNITDITSLQYLKNLKDLSLDENSVSDIKALSKLTKLQTLGLSGNKLDEHDLGSIKSLKSLTHLNLSGNRIKDMKVLTEFGSLKQVDLYSNPLTQSSAAVVREVRKRGAVVYIDDRFEPKITDIVSKESPMTGLTPGIEKRLKEHGYFSPYTSGMGETALKMPELARRVAASMTESNPFDPDGTFFTSENLVNLEEDDLYAVRGVLQTKRKDGKVVEQDVLYRFRYGTMTAGIIFDVCDPLTGSAKEGGFLLKEKRELGNRILK